MTIHLIRLWALGALGALAGCATLAGDAPASAAREDLVYFENSEGKQEKVATMISRAPDGRSAFFLRAPDGKIIVCAGQPPVASGAAADQKPALEGLQAAFFQNCLARANGFIDEREFLRLHRALVGSATRFAPRGVVGGDAPREK